MKLHIALIVVFLFPIFGWSQTVVTVDQSTYYTYYQDGYFIESKVRVDDPPYVGYWIEYRLVEKVTKVVTSKNNGQETYYYEVHLSRSIPSESKEGIDPNMVEGGWLWIPDGHPFPGNNKPMETTSPSAQIWDVEVGNWSAVWIRRAPNSNIFDGTWKDPNGKITGHTVIAFYKNGQAVAAQRTYASGGNYCTLDGTINSDETFMEGRAYDCTNKIEWNWKAYLRVKNKPPAKPKSSSAETWDVKVGNWSAVWIRRAPDSNIFDGTWKDPNGNISHTVIAFSQSGQNVSAQRTYSSGGNYCTLKGTINSGRNYMEGKAINCTNKIEWNWKAYRRK